MKHSLKTLPDTFSTAYILGENRQAIAFTDGGAFIVRLADDEENIESAREAHPMDNIYLTLQWARSPLILTDISFGALVEKLCTRTKLSKPFQWLQIGLDAEVATTSRLQFLQYVREGWSPESATFIRRRFLSGEISTSIKPDEAKSFCTTHGFTEFLPLLNEFAEVVPHFEKARLVWFSIFDHSLPEVINILLEKGLAAETHLALTRNDFSELDQLTEQLGQDPHLHAICPNIQEMLGTFSQNLRAQAVSQKAPAANPKRSPH